MKTAPPPFLQTSRSQPAGLPPAALVRSGAGRFGTSGLQPQGAYNFTTPPQPGTVFAGSIPGLISDANPAGREILSGVTGPGGAVKNVSAEFHPGAIGQARVVNFFVHPVRQFPKAL